MGRGAVGGWMGVCGIWSVKNELKMKQILKNSLKCTVSKHILDRDVPGSQGRCYWAQGRMQLSMYLQPICAFKSPFSFQFRKTR